MGDAWVVLGCPLSAVVVFWAVLGLFCFCLFLATFVSLCDMEPKCSSMLSRVFCTNGLF
jgi:hypothetical protein